MIIDIKTLLSDQSDIIQAIALGDQKAFRNLYDLYGEKVYNMALSYVQNKEDAEEVTQDVFANIFRNASKFKGEAAVSTWIYRISINTSLNLLKRRKKFSFLDFSDKNQDRPDFQHPGVLLERSENAKLLFIAIDTLPENQKTAFILSFVEDLKRQEVADIMEMSLKAIESLLQRAKANLREKLEKMYPHRRKNA